MNFEDGVGVFVHCKNSHRNKKWFLLVFGICWSDWTSRLFGENGPSFPSTSSKMQSDLKAASRRTSENYRTKGFRYQTPHFWAAYITFHLWGIIHPAKCWSEKCHYVKRKKAETHHQTREARTCEGETTRWGRGGKRGGSQVGSVLLFNPAEVWEKHQLGQNRRTRGCRKSLVSDDEGFYYC